MSEYFVYFSVGLCPSGFFFWVGLCPNVLFIFLSGVMSEWVFFQWGYVHLPLVLGLQFLLETDLTTVDALPRRVVVGSILHGVDPLSYFSFQPVLHDWCNKGRGMCDHVCGMMHIKEPLLLIGKSSPCYGSGFPLSLSEWSFTICLTPYNRK